MRRDLFALHLPNPDRVRADYAVLAELSRGLSGGDILNVCVNAIHVGSVDADPAKWKVTQGMLEREIGKARKATAEHSGVRTPALTTSLAVYMIPSMRSSGMSSSRHSAAGRAAAASGLLWLTELPTHGDGLDGFSEFLPL